MEAETPAPEQPAFRIFSTSKPKREPVSDNRPSSPPKPPIKTHPKTTVESDSFSDLGLSEWAVATCRELGMRRPTPVQSQCIPRILAGDNVLAVAPTGSGKTAAFTLPILHRLAEELFGVYALVLSPTRELATQLAEQFRALGAPINLRCVVAIGGYNTIDQAKALAKKPHVVIATPGRLRALMEGVEIAAAFSRTKFLVLDEADRVLDANFKEDLDVILRLLPKKRQTLFFSATMTGNLQTLSKVSGNKYYLFEGDKGGKTVETLKQQYLKVPPDLKELYLSHILSNMEEDGIRSAIVFVATCRTCHYLELLLEEVGQAAVALHSHKSQSLRLASLSRFKSGQVPVLLATDVASRGLDIPTVDLVINYNIPRDSSDYIHRVGRTARAGRGGLSISFITERDESLVHEIEGVIKRKLGEYNCDEKAVFEDITQVFVARRVAKMKMIDDGFEEQAQERKERKLKVLTDKGIKRKR
ncbi:DEAD-box ATP-dependent RNA helicase 36 [Carex littledalei]|uniref:DEAD-box ATP-dependent RNA helicase 36 n=1 Tax=Carex littledalei TaxID=544730 RepID=A0A833VFV7_9POAL|nr:DEAD-box ATP-dependent RNA helicase 36 [Carex littledalei]